MVSKMTTVAEFAGMAEKEFDVQKDKIPFTHEGKTFSFVGCPEKRLGDFGVHINSNIFALVKSHGGK